MRVLSVDRKRGRIKVQAESPDDLWHLSRVIEPGDVFYGWTFRREERRTDALRPEKGEKKRMYLGIRVESVEFRPFTDRLRVLGVIVEGPQDRGKHHSIDVSPGDTVELAKERWHPLVEKRLRSAERDMGRQKVVAVGIDDEEGVVGVLWNYGVETVATIRGGGGGKMFDGGGDRREFFGEVAGVVKNLLATTGSGVVLVAGPGFYRDEFVEFLKEKLGGEVHILVYPTSHGGLRGVYEAIKGGGGMKLLADHRVVVETAHVEKVLEAIKKDEDCAYGFEDVRNAVERGAVETLVVLESRLFDDTWRDLVEMAENLGAKVVLVSEHHEGGKKLAGLGGIAALLRYRV